MHGLEIHVDFLKIMRFVLFMPRMCASFHICIHYLNVYENRFLDSFRDWFRGYESNYAVIGGTACDLLMSEAEMDFRLTRDIDMVLIVEALSPEFGTRFWEYIKAAGYEHRRKSTNTPIYYRFSNPKSSEYPSMIELFSRRLEGIELPPDAVLTPLPLEDSLSSLSAILLDDDYYEFMKSGVKVVGDIPILDAPYLIPFKAKAWLDLSARKALGEQIDSKNIKKHKRDIIRLYELLVIGVEIELPQKVKSDLLSFVSANIADNIDELLHIADYYGIREDL